MRIVEAVGWYLPESLGGTELYVAALAARLRARGDDVVVTAPATGAAGPRQLEHEGIPVFRYPIPATITRAEARGLVAVRGTEVLHRWLRDRAPAIFHAHTFVSGLGLAELAAAREAGARIVVTCHSARLGFVCERGTMLHHGRALCDGLAEPVKCATCALTARGVPAPVAAALARAPQPLARAASQRWRGRAGTLVGMRALVAGNAEAQRRLFELADAVVVLSEWAGATLRANGAPAGKVVVNRLGVAAGVPVPPKPSPDVQPTRPPLTVGFVGRAESIKGLDDAVRAVASLAPDVPVQLRAVVLTGGAAERAVLEHCRRLAGGDARIRFEMPVPADRVGALLASLDLVVCPSRAVEGGPTVALEAHAAGTPVVGSAVPALSEIVRDGVDGRLVPAGDWRALAGVLAEAARAPEVTVDRWRRALRAPRTMDDVVADYRELFDRVR